ncbi:hypothetical protein HYH03_003239 [Edaphochlamys debaryana]|uniref:SOUL heme-binding protein n=1 Tax=Edaphochlamys debaryana TaxID=47281 RepID=A0A835YJY5_9CHLO|nr:hypothetical protein HYH03_003239 [Edaphochlamys debaryana]|eukprot:KAG2499054.1 hypothetical protein HYH03_003239 [Edaphochlamys debaryana]
MASLLGYIQVEVPKFAVLKTLEGCGEVRKYGPQIRAVVEYDVAPDAPIMDGLNNPFRSLAGYIFGKNQKRAGDSNEKVAMTAPVVMQKAPAAEKIAMTAPVVMQAGEGAEAHKRTMSFIMPSQYAKVEDLPLPKDAKVTLVEVPERTYAGLTFRGTMTPALAAAKEQELRQAAERSSVKLSQDPAAVQYGAFNPPWCLPWLKTNEVLIPVAE